MTDAPERIWAFWTPDDFEDDATITAYETVQHGGREYIRADLAPRWYRTDDPQNPPPRDGTPILVRGLPDSHPKLEVTFTKPSFFSAYWSELDEAFCLNGGDWLGPFIAPTHWSPIHLPTGGEWC